MMMVCWLGIATCPNCFRGTWRPLHSTCNWSRTAGVSRAIMLYVNSHLSAFTAPSMLLDSSSVSMTPLSSVTADAVLPARGGHECTSN